MKKTIALHIALILLLMLILSACSGGGDTISTPDEFEKPNVTSFPENISLPEEDNQPVLENSILDYFDRNDESITVRDGLMVYTFNKDPNKSTISVPFETKTGIFDGEWKAYTYFKTLFYKNQFIQVVHSKPSFDERDNVVSFDIISDGITMPFKRMQDFQEPVYLWNGEAKNGYAPYVKITCPFKDNTHNYVQGNVDCSFTYEMLEDYKCRLYFPNGKTAEYTIKYCGNGIYLFEEHKFNPDGAEIKLGHNQKIKLKGPYPYTGVLNAEYKLYSYEDGVAVTNIPLNDGMVVYREPIYDVPESETYKTGTITFGEFPNSNTYNILYSPATPNVDDEEMYMIYSYEQMKLTDEVTVRYYPTRNYTEDESGFSYCPFDVTVYFTWEMYGDCIIITYPNGYVAKKLMYKDSTTYRLIDYPFED